MMRRIAGRYIEIWYEKPIKTTYVGVRPVIYPLNYIEKHFDGVTVSRPQGTYMLFIDCAGWLEKHGKTMDELMKAGWDVGVVWQDGRAFHGQTHIRLNLALPLSRVQEAFDRLDKYVFNA